MTTIFLFQIILISNLIFAQNIEEELGRLYVDKKYGLLLEKTETILKEEPNNAFVNLVRGRVFVDQFMFTEGKHYIQEAIENDKDKSWIKAWGLNYLAMIEYASGNKVNAKRYLEDCLIMSSTKNVSKSSKGLLILLGLDDYYVNFDKIETEHFVFYFQPETVVPDKNEFIESREKAFIETNNFFNTNLPKKIDFIVWNNNSDAQKVGIKELGFARPEFCCIHTKANQTIGHELTHVITHYITINPIKTRFINEGTSVAFDMTSKSKLELAQGYKVTEGFEGKILIIDAWKNPDKYPEWVYYPLAGEFIKRLIAKGGNEKFLKLITNQKYEYAKELYGQILEEVIEELEKEIN